MRSDNVDRRRRVRWTASILASLVIHALLAFFLFSTATSSSQQAAPESFPGAVTVSVTRAAPAKPAPVTQQRAAVPPPHAQVVPQPKLAAQPKSAPPHPRVLHELAKNTPTGPPNPTPVPVSSAAPNPLPTRAEIAVTPAPIPAAVPTSVPARIVAVSVKAPPTTAPLPKPSVVPTSAPRTPQPQPTVAPKPQLITPVPQPSALEATAQPLAATPVPQAVITPGAPSQIHVAVQPTPGPVVKAPSPGPAPTAAQQPGPKAVGSPGPRPVSPVKGPSAARPVTVPATPRPAAPSGAGAKRAKSLNERLKNLIPTAAPSVSPAPPKHYSFLGNMKPTPEPEPTPPADVLAATKFLYVENVGSQHWKVWPLGATPEEIYVKMYVTSVHKVGFVNWCTGWVLRMPMTDYEHRHWIVEPNQSFMCAGHLEPFTAPGPVPTGTP